MPPVMIQKEIDRIRALSAKEIWAEFEQACDEQAEIMELLALSRAHVKRLLIEHKRKDP